MYTSYAYKMGYVAGINGLRGNPPADLARKFHGEWRRGYNAGRRAASKRWGG